MTSSLYKVYNYLELHKEHHNKFLKKQIIKAKDNQLAFASQVFQDIEAEVTLPTCTSWIVL